MEHEFNQFTEVLSYTHTEHQASSGTRQLCSFDDWVDAWKWIRD